MDSEDEEMSEYMKEREAQLFAWLDENVITTGTPKEVTISGIDFSWSQMRGTFFVSLDGKALEDCFYVHIDSAGRVTITPPMFVSPLATPASFPAVMLSRETESAIKRALQRVIPIVRGYGLHKDINQIIVSGTAFEDRVLDRDEYLQMRQLIDEGNVVVSEKVDYGVD